MNVPRRGAPLWYAAPPGQGDGWRPHRPGTHCNNRCGLGLNCAVEEGVWCVQLAQRDSHPPTERGEELEVGVPSR